MRPIGSANVCKQTILETQSFECQLLGNLVKQSNVDTIKPHQRKYGC